MLSFNGIAAAIEESDIENAKLCRDRGVVMKPQSLSYIGMRVRVRTGLLEGFISHSKDDQRLIVPISLINQSIAVDVDVHLLEPVA
jgi:hypothetical protein